MDNLVRLLMKQEGVSECRLYSQLPQQLSNGSKTHPKQIRQKAGNAMAHDEARVYGALQAMFNAKPDLAICSGQDLFVYECKLTLDFDAAQQQRTQNIAQVWATLLYADLGFPSEPEVHMRTLGLAMFAPDVSWESVSLIAEVTYPANDRTRLALAHASHLVSNGDIAE